MLLLACSSSDGGHPIHKLVSLSSSQERKRNGKSGGGKGQTPTAVPVTWGFTLGQLFGSPLFFPRGIPVGPLLFVVTCKSL